MRLALAVSTAKTAAALSRALGRGGGTALPGLIAERIEPRSLGRLGRQLGRGRVLITGTNGKTTTAHLLSSILSAAGLPHLHNREGSNMTRGIVSALLGAAKPSGTLGSYRDALGLFEVDEATLPAVTRALDPSVMVFTNLFRDQLDRYGEVDHVAGLWRESLKRAKPGTALVLNADDPSVAALAEGWQGPVHWFGVEDAAMHQDSAGAFDARWCPVCGGDYEYGLRFYAHVGHWRCRDCGRARPALVEGERGSPLPGTAATGIRLGVEHATFTVPELGELTIGVTGLYNVINALAAIAAARVLGVEPEPIRRGLAQSRAAFGRQEHFDLGNGSRLRLVLCKNPAGANQVIHWLGALEGSHQVAVLLNDRFADGQDVSWIWDVDYELLADRVTVAWAGGGRAEDMALRLKYAGWPEVTPIREPGALLDAVIAGSSQGGDVFCLATYTAMLDLRAELARRGIATNFWEQ